MRILKQLFDNNQAWAEHMNAEDPGFFETLSRQQAPKYLWIGCADSRVPANDIVGLLPGELFVHRNVANVVIQTDMNCLSVIQYAVDVLKVQHIIVCGHYGCGGVQAAMQDRDLGLIDNWLREIKELYYQHESLLDDFSDQQERLDRMCELNVIRQVYNVCHTTIVQQAWKRGQSLSVHGWIYCLKDGLLRDMSLCVTHPEEVTEYYRRSAMYMG